MNYPATLSTYKKSGSQGRKSLLKNGEEDFWWKEILVTTNIWMMSFWWIKSVIDDVVLLFWKVANPEILESEIKLLEAKLGVWNPDTRGPGRRRPKRFLNLKNKTHLYHAFWLKFLYDKTLLTLLKIYRVS